MNPKPDENLDSPHGQVPERSHGKLMKAKHKKLSQEEIEFLGKQYSNDPARVGESKARHKKTPAMFVKKTEFLETIKGYNDSATNFDSKKI